MMSKLKIILMKSSDGPGQSFWIRVMSPNGRTVLDSEVYASESNQKRAAKRLTSLTGWKTEQKISHEKSY